MAVRWQGACSWEHGTRLACSAPEKKPKPHSRAVSSEDLGTRMIQEHIASWNTNSRGCDMSGCQNCVFFGSLAQYGP